MNAPNETFDMLDQYLGLRMGAELRALQPGRLAVIQTPLRTAREKSYGYVRALWSLCMEDGRCIVSVPPGVGEKVFALLAGDADWGSRIDAGLGEKLRASVDTSLASAGLPATNRIFEDLYFACNANLLHRHSRRPCLRLRDASISPAEGLTLPEHCFPDGVAYGVVADGHVASVAYAHLTGTMEDRVADLGVETAPAYRRRGFAQTAVSAVVAHFADRGGEALYGCDPRNAASIATARSVGFVHYGKSLILAVPWTGRL